MIRRLGTVELLRLLLVVSFVAPALIFGLFAFYTRHTAFADADREMNWTSKVSLEHATKVFDSYRLVADRVQDILLGLDDGAIKQRELGLHQNFQDIITGLPQILSFIVLDRNGHLLVATASYPVLHDLDFSDRDYFNALKSGDLKTFINKVQLGRLVGKVFFGWAQPRTTKNGSFNGVINIAISAQFFMRFYNTLVSETADNADGRVVSMIRDDGQVLVRYPASPDNLMKIPSSSPFFEHIKKNTESGTYISHGDVETGTPQRLFSYRKVPDLPIYIVAGRSIDAIMGEWQHSMLLYLAGWTPATAALIFVAFAALRAAQREQRALLKAQEEMRRRETVEDQLRQSQKMEAVGQLTGGLAHDFNNLLTGIGGSLELLQSRISQGRVENLDRYTNAAQDACRRAAALTHRLLAFSRRQTLDPKPTKIDRLVREIEELVRRTVGPQIELRVVNDPGLWATLVDQSQLENALLNLCINARDAMPEGGRLTIETANIWLNGPPAGEREIPPGQYVSLCVSDTGTGMTPEVMRRAFDPFFTTKPIGMGTGLGLSMIYGFVQQSGGQAKIHSELGKGTQVLLYLPRYQGALDPIDDAAATPLLQRMTENQTVMLVDDESTIRLMIGEVLDDLGYNCLQAVDGAEALPVLMSRDRIDLLISDVGLPGGMNGRQLADAARNARPDLKVLFITGYAESAVLNHGHLQTGMYVLTKPFTADILASRIREIIAST